MKYILLMSLVSTVFLHQTNLIEERKTQIAKIEKSLEFESKVEYSFEHLEGETSYYTDQDKSNKKIVMNWNRGSYGSAERVYYMMNNQLIYFRNLEHDWTEANRYSLRQTIYYFSDDHLGYKTSRQIETLGEKWSKNDLSVLEESTADTAELDANDVQRIVKTLAEFEIKQAGEDE